MGEQIITATQAAALKAAMVATELHREDQVIHRARRDYLTALVWVVVLGIVAVAAVVGLVVVAV